jgi:TRAP-type C4-dicarboxylate transport system permease small subunit
MKILKSILNFIHMFLVISGEILLLALVAVVSINVFLRYLFNSGLSWAEEIPSNVLVPFFVFISMAIGINEELHININILIMKLPAWVEVVLRKLKYISILIIGIIFLIYGYSLVKWTSTSILPATGLPASLQYIILPIVSIPIMYKAIINILGIKKEHQDLSHIDKLLSGEGE